MEQRVVDSQPPTRPGRNDMFGTMRGERGSTLTGIAAIINALVAVINARLIWIPGMIIFASLLILVGFYKRDKLEVFTDTSLAWLNAVLYWFLVGVVTVAMVAFIWTLISLGMKIYQMIHTMRMDALSRKKAQEQIKHLELKNKQLEKSLHIQDEAIKIAFQVFQSGTVPGKADLNKMVFEFHGLPQVAQPGQGEQKQIGLPGDPYPLNMRYEDIRGRVPEGHILVGIAPGGEIDTAERSVGALVWIVGNSGSGKTNTTVIRVEERHAVGHRFYGIDPHFFKDDSLTNAVAPYVDSFLMPMARDAKQGVAVLNAFLGEFDGRKNGRIPKPWDKRTILVDEVGALADVDEGDEDEEKELFRLLKRVARVCGQEARNFEMGGIFISQQASHLAWLRKMATMVIVHQLLMMSERGLACNEDKAVMNDMEFWPIGRTYIYGVGFGQAGARTRQQPSYKRTETPAVPPITIVQANVPGALEYTSGLEAASQTEEEENNQQRTPITGPLNEIQPLPAKKTRRATLVDAIEVWNAFPSGIGRPKLRKELQARGLECSDHLAQSLLDAIKQQLNGDVVGGED